MAETKLCGGCVRFQRGIVHNPWRCSAHCRKDDTCCSADMQACSEYLDSKAYQKQREKEFQEQEKKRLKLWAENEVKPPVKMGWGMDYDHTTDSAVSIPDCPVCGNMPHDFEQCQFCGIHFIKEDAVKEEYMQQNTGEKEVIGDCPVCDGVEHTVYHKKHGKWSVAGGYCEKCKRSFIV